MTRIAPRQYKPDIAIPPGATIQEFLDAQCMTQEELAQRLNKKPSHINELINGKRALTVDTAISLEHVLGTSADFWLNLERGYRLTIARLRDIENRARDIKWMKDTIPVSELTKRNYVPKTRDDNIRLKAVYEFFAVSDIDAWHQFYSRRIGVALRQSKSRVKHIGRAATWLRLGELKSQGKACGNFNKQRFLSLLHEIRHATKEDPNVFLPMLEQLANCGVLVTLVKEIPGAGISGATQWIGKNKAHILLSLLYKSDDQFWFTFFHEAGHILLHDKDDVFLEGLTGFSKNRQVKEDEANRFAADFLIPSQEAKQLPDIRDKSSALAFAAELNIAPGIVVGRLQHDGFITPATANYWQLKRRYDWAEQSS